LLNRDNPQVYPQYLWTNLRTLRHQQHLSDVLAILNIFVRRSSVVKAKALRNLRPDDAAVPEIQQLFAPAADAIDLAPQVPQVDAEYALVCVDHGEGIEL
jgi:hypothetical protein